MELPSEISSSEAATLDLEFGVFPILFPPTIGSDPSPPVACAVEILELSPRVMAGSLIVLCEEGCFWWVLVPNDF